MWQETEQRTEKAGIAMQVLREFVCSSSARQYVTEGSQVIRCQDEVPDKSINDKRDQLTHAALDYLLDYFKD